MNDEPIIHGEPAFFNIGEERFKLAALPLEKAFAGLDILRVSVEPLIAEFAGFYEKDPDIEGSVKLKKSVTEEVLMGFMIKCVSLTGSLTNLMQIFAPHCEVRVGDSLLQCDKSSTIFARRTALAIAWIIKCLTIQYSDFLDGTGLALIMKTVKSLVFQNTSDQKSCS